MEMHKVAFTRLSHSPFHFKSTSATRIACTASPLPPQKQTVNGPGILCDPCGGAGWVVCDFCEGQKTNVKARNNRLYRRCPSCRATGFLICQKCRVFKCVTFPSDRDSVSEF
ncbi:uncharacterized protein LOC131046331 [Cryptomeria japonica]|uniref:uncharacterized protein LOC131046331 n=1 Tax=Cryptomeria japonica TaxID=3369 RepID=UPI0027DA8DB3|nr:uncharacterized protein LOC131046331 [Cryptomeria japonica]